MMLLSEELDRYRTALARHSATLSPETAEHVLSTLRNVVIAAAQEADSYLYTVKPVLSGADSVPLANRDAYRTLRTIHDELSRYWSNPA